MSSELYFIPRIAAGFREPDTVAALGKAIAEIRRLGQLPSHAEGHAQFRAFMVAVMEGTYVGPLAAAGGEPAMDFGEIRRAWDSPVPQRMPLTFSLDRDGALFATITFDGTSQVRSLEALRPGRYSLCFRTGRLVWQGSLTERQLVWTQAFPRRPLGLAADTGTDLNRPTTEMVLLDGELLLRTYPGLEAGRLEVELRLRQEGPDAR